MRLLTRTVEVLRTEGVRPTAKRAADLPPLAIRRVARPPRSFDWKYGTETAIIETAYLADGAVAVRVERGLATKRATGANSRAS